MRRVLCLAVLVLAGCSAPAEPGPPAVEGDPSQAGSADDRILARDFVVDYTYYVEECRTGYNTFSRGSATTVHIPRANNATALDLTFTWTAQTALAETMRFALVGPDGYDTAVRIEGRSPLAWHLAAADLSVTRPDPWVAGTPVDCGQPAGLGSSLEQAVHVDAAWT